MTNSWVGHRQRVRSEPNPTFDASTNSTSASVTSTATRTAVASTSSSSNGWAPTVQIQPASASTIGAVTLRRESVRETITQPKATTRTTIATPAVMEVSWGGGG